MVRTGSFVPSFSTRKPSLELYRGVASQGPQKESDGILINHLRTPCTTNGWWPEDKTVGVLALLVLT